MAKNPSRRKTKSSVPALRGTPYTRWTITGVSEETRTAVRKAAHKEGLSIGAWVDKTLHASAIETLKGGSPLLTLPPEVLAAFDDMSERLDRIEQQLGDKASSMSIGDFDEITEDFRKRAGHLFDQMQKSTSTVVDNVVEQTDTTMTQIREIGSATIDRIREATETALDSVRQTADAKSDEAEKSEAKPKKTPKKT